MSHVLVLQHEPGEGPGTLGAALAAAGLEARVVRGFSGFDEAVPASLGDARGLVILGGGLSVTELDRLPRLQEELRLVRAALEAGAPVLGLCLGAQLLAAALGGAVLRAARKEVGWYRVRLAGAARDDQLLAGEEDSLVAFHWHEDAFALPPGAVQLASSTLTPCQAFRAGVSWGFQFHPEVDAGILAAMVDGGARELEAAGVDGGALLEGGARHLPALVPFARRVFDRWASLVLTAGASRGKREG